MRVKMRDALTDDVVDGDERSVGRQRGGQRRRNSLDHTEERADMR